MKLPLCHDFVFVGKTSSDKMAVPRLRFHPRIHDQLRTESGDFPEYSGEFYCMTDNVLIFQSVQYQTIKRSRNSRELYGFCVKDTELMERPCE